MITRLVIVLALASQGTLAFVPNALHQNRVANHRQSTSNPKSALRFGLDPASFQDISHSLNDAFSTISISDAVDAVDALAAPDGTADAVAAAAADNSGGWFGFLVSPITGLLQFIHTVLTAVGVKENAWGVSIIFLTLLIKALTFPLTKSQLESTNKMQALQPQVKEIQAKYQSNPEVMNQKVAEVYQTNEVNPLAGCIPSLVQIPVFIGLYRAVLNLAKEDKLNEPFLWLPSLEGPTYGADPANGSDWILKNWVDGVPSLGWDDTLAFLVLPVVLVISQFVSMELMQPKDAAARQNNAVLKILPVMIGWFSLNVPSALGIYWVVNNFVTTATTLAIRSQMPAVPDAASAAPSTPSQQAIFSPTPLREKPEGFQSQAVASDGVKPITSNVIEADVVVDDEEEPSNETSDEGETPQPKRRKGKKRKGKKGKN